MPRRLDREVGAGAAGGLGYALLALGGRRVSAIDEVLRECGFGVAAARSDLVVTGAGRVDWSTMRGSVVAGVAAATLETGRPTVLVAGECLVGRRETMSLGLAGTYAVADTPARHRGHGRRPRADARRAHRAGRPHLVARTLTDTGTRKAGPPHPVVPTCHGTDRARERRRSDVSLG